LRLLRPAEEITVWDIMQAVDEKGCATERTIQVNMFEAAENSLLDANALYWRSFIESQRAALSNVSLASICHSANVIEGVNLR
jgi:DNA-binding IscR family transcriptional regulator